MGMLAAFAGGAAQGVQSHWADIKEKVAAEAKQAFEERMVQTRADAQVNAAKQQQENAFAFEQETLDTRLGMADKTAARTAETENSLTNKYAADAIAREEAARRSQLTVEQEFAEPSEQWLPVYDEKNNIVNQRNSKTGKLAWSPKERGKGGNGDGTDFKTNLEPLSMGDDMDYPNVWLDTKTGIVVDPQNQLSKSTIDKATIEAEIDKEIEDRRGGVMGFLKKDDAEAFDGMTEDQFRKMELQRRLSEAPTLADELGFGKDKVVRSEEELAARYQQMGIPMPGAQPGGGYMTQADSQTSQQGKVSYSPEMFEEGEQEAPQQAGENSVLAPNTKGFEARMNSGSPSIKNSDGTVSTHRMASAEVDGKKIAYPTIIQQPDGSLKQLSDDEAIKYAMKTGEFREFKSQSEAQRYAEGGYKEGTDLDKPKLSDDERAALEEFGIKVDSPDLNKPMRNPYANSDVTGTVKDFFAENAPVTLKALDRIGEIPGNINQASTGMLSDVGRAIAEKHRDMVASGERMKAKDKERMKQKLTEAFFNGEQSVDAAKMVLENDSATARQRVAARAYLKLKGQM